MARPFMHPRLASASDVDLSAEAEPKVPEFDEIYRAYFAFAWRALWHLGVPAPNVADAAQDVFVVVHRRLGDLRSAEDARSWVYGIVARVARDYRRQHRRKGIKGAGDPDEVADLREPSAHAHLEQNESVALLEQLLGTLNDEYREVLVLTELEQMTVPEIAELLGVNVNTIYTRLRAARRDFERALSRHRARQRRSP